MVYHYAVTFRRPTTPEQVDRTHHTTYETPEQFAERVSREYDWASDVLWCEVNDFEAFDNVAGTRPVKRFAK
jgi:hypothetical protein